MLEILLIICLCAAPVAAGGPEIVSVRSFGAKADGEADATAAILRAIETAQRKDLPVVLPRGKRRLTKPLVITGQLLQGFEAGGWNADAMPRPQLIIDQYRQ